MKEIKTPQKEALPGPREKFIEQFYSFEPLHFASDKVGTLGSAEIMSTPEPFLSFYASDSWNNSLEDIKTRWLRREASDAELAQLAEAFADFMMIRKGKVIEGRFRHFDEAQRDWLDEQERLAA